MNQRPRFRLSLIALALLPLGAQAQQAAGDKPEAKDATKLEAVVVSATKRLQPLYDGSRNRWYFDDLNDLVFVRFGRKVANALWWFDRRVVDGTVNGVATLTSSGGRGLRQIQTGRVQNYALGIAFGLVAIAAAYLVIAG